MFSSPAKIVPTSRQIVLLLDFFRAYVASSPTHPASRSRAHYNERSAQYTRRRQPNTYAFTCREYRRAAHMYVYRVRSSSIPSTQSHCSLFSLSVYNHVCTDEHRRGQLGHRHLARADAVPEPHGQAGRQRDLFGVVVFSRRNGGTKSIISGSDSFRPRHDQHQERQRDQTSDPCQRLDGQNTEKC